MLAAAAILGCTFPAAAQSAAGPPRNLNGVIVEENGQPLPDVEVAYMVRGEPYRAAVSSRDGTFHFRNLPGGLVLLRLRRLGYGSRIFEVMNIEGTPDPLSFVLKPVASELEEVLVSGEDTRLREFLDHRRTRSSFARFYDDTEIRQKGVSYTSELFRSMPGVTLRNLPSGGNSVRIRGCQPMLWVDGQRVPGAEMDEVAVPSDIAGIEFYSSMAGTPAQYTERTNRACGTVLVWTKNR